MRQSVIISWGQKNREKDMSNKNLTPEEKKARSKKTLRVILIIFGVFLVASGIFVIVMIRHLHYDIQPHEFYDIETLQAEGRSYNGVSDVYFTHDVSPEGLMRAYQALGVQPEGKVAFKLSTGEGTDTLYLSPDLIKNLVQSMDGNIVECNTAYKGTRLQTEMHMQTAQEHGFTDIAEVDIMDRDGYMVIPVEGGTHLTENWVGKNLADYDYVVTLTHFKGHMMAGFGGALKNISIGIASSDGKMRIHSAGLLNNHIFIDPGCEITNQDDFTESMAEAAKSVYDYENHGENIIFINVLNNLSVDCDCDPNPHAPEMEDIGIMASFDPVAIDQASVDQIFATTEGSASLQERILSKNGLNILKHGEEIGLGNRAYRLIDIDEDKAE